MHLQQLNIFNYKNILECDLQFSPKFNCFVGDNGMGKTNVLDAIYFLSFTKSAISSVDSQCINHHHEFFMIKGTYQRKGESETISTAVKRRTKKVFRRGDKAYERMSDHIGLIPAVMISPNDSELIAEGSDERRRFMDSVISQYDINYLKYLQQYNKVLQNRNSLLKIEGNIDLTVLEIYNEQLSDYAEYICSKRHDFIEEFTPIFNEYYQKIANNKEKTSLGYVSHHHKGKLTDLLNECITRDRVLGFTTRGAHKDDIEMLLDGYPIKKTGSQGQNKSFLIALKLSQYIYLKQTVGVKPLLIIDDLFDKLDSRRVGNIIGLLSSDEFGQIFISDTNRQHTDNIIETTSVDSKIFSVNDGIIGVS